LDVIRTILLYALALPKSLYFNLRYLRFRDALRLPIIVSHRVWLFRARGTVRIAAPLAFGMVKIGFGEVSIFDQWKSRAIWEVTGDVVFNGRCSLGHGSKISVGDGARLAIGRNFVITAESALVCKKEITIGDDTLFSWDILVMDTDFHPIRDGSGRMLNPDAEVVIGDHVWVGCRALILKGSVIPSGCVVAAGTTIAREFTGENAVLGGNPVREIREGVRWEM
jgi:carbonic anhydrase/acetyltransferase-like protein (isoleucine patch superfamily)